MRTREDWRRVRDEHLQPCPAALPGHWSALEARFAGREPLGMPLCGAFGHAHLMGDEHLLVTYYDDPALIHEIRNTGCGSTGRSSTR